MHPILIECICYGNDIYGNKNRKHHYICWDHDDDRMSTGLNMRYRMPGAKVYFYIVTFRSK